MRSEPDDPLTREEEERQREAFIAAVVAAAPPLDEETCDQIADLLARRPRRTGAA